VSKRHLPLIILSFFCGVSFLFAVFGCANQKDVCFILPAAQDADIVSFEWKSARRKSKLTDPGKVSRIMEKVSLITGKKTSSRRKREWWGECRITKRSGQQITIACYGEHIVCIDKDRCYIVNTDILRVMSEQFGHPSRKSINSDRDAESRRLF
jgi:hypothetical protein